MQIHSGAVLLGPAAEPKKEIDEAEHGVLLLDTSLVFLTSAVTVRL
jgi:hypothetical protein